MTTPTGSAVLGQELLDAGIDTVFGVMGEISIDMLAVLTRGGGRYLPARHESAALAMADGFARASGRIGVATVTYGPGLTNALTGLISAQRHGGRVLLITGQRARLDSQQGLDQVALLAPTGIAVVTVTTQEEVRGSIARALAAIEATGRSVVLNYRDQAVETPFRTAHRADASVAEATTPPPAAARHSADALARAAELIARSQRPVILAGRGAIHAREALVALADATGAALLTSLMAKGLFGAHPAHLGLSGGFATQDGRACMGEADQVIAFGASLNPWTTLMGEGYPQARLIQIDSDPAAFARSGIAPAVAIHGDAGAVAESLLDSRRSRGPAMPWWGRTAAHAESPFGLGGADPRGICRALDAVLPRERVLVTDAGHFFEAPIAELSVPDADAFLWTAGFGAIGCGLGTAIGAAVARPDRLCVLFIGDGGLMMNLGDLDTAVRAGIRLLVVVMDDAAYGAEVKHLDHRGLPAALAQFREIDFAAVGRSLGLEALTLAGPDDVKALPDRLARCGGPLLAHVRLDGTVTAHYVALLQRLVAREFGV